MAQPGNYNLAIAWNWEYDADFVAGVERECASRGLSTYRIEGSNVHETVHALRAGELAFDALYDRASDADDAFLPLARLLDRRHIRIINRHEHAQRAIDKATMHLEFIEHGLHVPYTIIISPYNKKREVELSLSALEQLGRPFIIKPANTTGGGIGVVLGAETLKDVIETRQHHKNDKYLLQETVKPVSLDGRRAWFRALYAFGEVLPCWWDDTTRIYMEVSSGDEARHGLRHLRGIMLTIQDVCRLDFFSSEIALTPGGTFVVVDYVNEVCDMRLQSGHVDGVPDAVVHRVEGLIAEEVRSHVERPRT